jgi:hypothetical protein
MLILGLSAFFRGFCFSVSHSLFPDLKSVSNQTTRRLLEAAKRRCGDKRLVVPTFVPLLLRDSRLRHGSPECFENCHQHVSSRTICINAGAIGSNYRRMASLEKIARPSLSQMLASDESQSPGRIYGKRRRPTESIAANIADAA